MANEKLVNRENLKAFRQANDKRFEDGKVIPAKSLVAQELENVSTESGDTQETPFILQGTGTANGTGSVDTGTVGKHIQKQGSTYCVNQLQSGSTGMTARNGTLNYDDSSKTFTNTITTVGTQYGYENQLYRNVAGLCIPNHTYILICEVKSPKTAPFHYYLANASTTSVSCTANTWTRIISVVTDNYTSGNHYFSIEPQTNPSSYGFEVGDVISYRNVQIIDLTQWFNNNIPTDLTTNPSHFVWYHNYGDYIPYNTGTLVSGNGRYIVCGGRNIWNGNYSVENKLIFQNGTFYDTTNYNVSDYVRIKSNTQYALCGLYGQATSASICFYDKDKNYISGSEYGVATTKIITSPSNAYYTRFSVRKTQASITVLSLYYSSGTDYDKYFPYEEPKVYDTGNEELLSTGVALNVSGERTDAYDYKEPDGTTVRNVGTVDLSEYQNELTYNSTFGCWILPITTGVIGKYNGGNEIPKMFAAGKTPVKYWGTDKENDGSMSIQDNGALLFGTANSSTKPNGIIIYELATPTTTQGTSFPENMEINDYGTMGWYSSYTDENTNTFTNVPQGCKIFYPAWYRGFIDSLGQREDIDWNADNVVSQTQLGAVDTKHDNLYAIIQENVGGALRHQLVAQVVASGGSLTFNDTGWVDISTLNWTYNNPNGTWQFIADNLTGAKSQGYGLMAQKYLRSTPTSWGSLASGYFQLGADAIRITDTNITDINTFKASIKGIMLAFEKAS